MCEDYFRLSVISTGD